MKKLLALLAVLVMAVGFACTASAELTDSVLEGKVMIEGVFYQMPIPVQQLLADGWTFDREDIVLENQQRTSVVFVKDNVAFYSWVINEYAEPKKVSETHVAVMEFGPAATGTEKYDLIDVQFSNTVNINTTEKELMKALGDPSSTAGGYPVWRGSNAKYISPSISFSAKFDSKLFSSELKFFQIEYLPADFSVEGK